MRTDSISDSISRIAGLTLVNALVFQEVLADYESQVQHLRQTLQANDAISAFADHWAGDTVLVSRLNILAFCSIGTEFKSC